MKKVIRLACALALLAGLAPVAAAQEDKSDNVTLETSFPYTIDESDPFFSSGTDIDFSGDFIYAMQQGLKPGMGGALHIFKATTKKVTKVGMLPCGGKQNDVAVVKRGLVAIGYHDGNCAPASEGVLLVNVKNPKKPKVLGSVEMAEGTHTITVYPGEALVYASPGGLANADGETRIIDVSAPMKPEIVATFTSSPIGCHDLSFFISEDQKLAFCPGVGETQIWDVSDPLAPVILSRTPTPQVFFNHSATFSPDGNLLVVGDEAHGVTSCAGVPTGAIWFYDVSNPAAPVLVGYHGVARGSVVSSFWATPDTWCSAHMYNFKPGTRLLVTAWYEGGINVLDLEDPRTPSEVGFYRASGDFSPWAAYWAGNNIWTSDEHVENGGVEVFSFKP